LTSLLPTATANFRRGGSKYKLLAMAIQNKNGEATKNFRNLIEMRQIAFLKYFTIFVVMEKMLVYAIIGIVYFVFSRLTKKKEQQPNDIPNYEPHSKPQQTTTSKPKQLTFEELLKEITESKQPEKPVYETKKPVYQTIPQTRRIDYDDDLKEEEKDLEDVEYDYRKKDNIYNVYEQAKSQAFVKPSLEETMKVKDTVVKFGKFKAFERETKRNLLEEYTKSFRDPEGLKKAVVMSEILNRKF
jgi:hypothetical protein